MAQGFVITEKGQKWIAQYAATKPSNIVITRVMVGSGELTEGDNPEQFDNLVQPVAQASSTIPMVKNNIISFIVEYRNDMNGGLKEGFWLREFGVFARDGEQEILLYYATLEAYPQYVDAYQNNKICVKKYPVSIAITGGIKDNTKVKLEYSPAAFVTEERMKEFTESETLPYLQEALKNSDSMIQKALESKADAETVAAQLAQKANSVDVSIALAEKANSVDMIEELNKKANKSDMLIALSEKANAQEVQQALNQKADAETMTTELEKKADEMEMLKELAKKANKNDMVAELAKKADKDDMQKELDQKADLVQVEELLGQTMDESSILMELDKKANKTDVQIELDKKADAEMVQEELGKKADTEVVQQELDKKADSETVSAALALKADNETMTTELGKKANSSHNHSASDINSGTLPVARGGTGNTTGNAATATKLQTARTIDGMNFDGSANIVHFGVCDTAADVAAKTVTVPHFSYVDGARIMVLFTKGTTLNQSTTLNVNNLGAKNIIGAYNRWPSNIIFESGNIVELVYYKGLFIITTANAISLANTRTIDGMNFNGSTNIVHFGICSTAATTAEKTVALTGFVLTEGARVAVYFANANTAGSPMLNINGTGAHYLAYRNGNWAKNGHWEAKDIIEFVYYSNHWIMLTANAHILTTPRAIQTNLGSTSSANFDGSANITPGVTGTLPVANGGTGAITASTALSNLGGFPKSGGTITGNVKISGSSSLHIGRANTITRDGNEILCGYNNYFMVDFCTIESATENTYKLNGYLSCKAGDTIYYFHHFSNKAPVAYVVESYNKSTRELKTKTTINTTTINGKLGCLMTLSHDGAHYSGGLTIGSNNIVVNGYAYILGNENTTSYSNSILLGNNLISTSANMITAGKYNVYNGAGRFVIGKGSSESARANCFRVTDTSVCATGNYNSTGADYAEYFEWEDDNVNKEDRRGLFVSLYGEKISLANSNSDFILGIITGNPSIIGDSHEDQWNGMYLYDIYGTPIMEEIEVIDEPVIDEEGNEIPQQPHKEIRQKLNPDYDPTKEYIPRSERPEWAAVGMMGKLVAIDDGSCEVGGWCTAGNGGIATKSEQKTKFYVMKRIDESHIKVLIL